MAKIKNTENYQFIKTGHYISIKVQINFIVYYKFDWFPCIYVSKSKNFDVIFSNWMHGNDFNFGMYSIILQCHSNIVLYLVKETITNAPTWITKTEQKTKTET